jgi:hypothetical protein
MKASLGQFLEAPPSINSGFAQHTNIFVLIPENNAPQSSYSQNHLESPRVLDAD